MKHKTEVASENDYLDIMRKHQRVFHYSDYSGPTANTTL